MECEIETASGGGCSKRRSADEIHSDNDESDPCPKHVTHVMENLENIIHQILIHLPMKCLNTAMRICRKWHEIASHVKKSRKQVSWVFAEYYTHQHLKDAVLNPINRISSYPEAAIIFASSALYEKQLHYAKACESGSLSRVAKKERIGINEYMKRSLPANCQLCGVVTDGIVGTHSNKLTCEEIEEDEAISCLLLPVLQGVAVHQLFASKLDYFCLDMLQTAKGDLHAVTDMPEDHEALLTLLFYEDPHLSLTHLAPARVIMENKTCPVVAGAMVGALLDFNPQFSSDDYERKEVAGVVFSVPEGSTDVKVASVYLDDTVNNEAQVLAKLNQLKQCHLPETNSIAFMFACVSRGEEYYGKPNFESALFRKIFPQTPLIGLFGNGEICHDYLPDYNKEGSVQEWRQKVALTGEDVHHSFCTAFVLLSLGKQGGCKVV